MANGLKALGSYLADDPLSDEALDFVADPYADRVTRIQRSGQSSPELQAFFARTDAIQEQRDAERAVEEASRLPQVKAREDMPQEGVPPLLRKTEGMETRVSSVSEPSNLGLNSFLRQLAASRPSSEAQPSRQPRGSDLGVAPAPPPEGVSANRLDPFFKPVNKSNLPPKGIRLAVETSPTMTVAAPRAGPSTPKPAIVTSPIPVASTQVKADVPDVVAGTIPPTTPTQSAPPAGTSSTVKPPPVDAGSSGDDEMGRLSMGQALVRALEGSGSVISGQNLRSGAADTLGERMKQIEALRAKKLERQEGLEVERSQNNQTLDMYKSLFPDKANSLEALRDLTGKGAVFKQGLDAWMKREELEKAKIPVAEARAGDIGAAKVLKEKKSTTEDLLRDPKARKLDTAADFDEARIKALRAKSTADVLALTKSQATVADAGKAKIPSKDAIKYIREDLKTAEKAITPTLENFKAIESASPGFAFGRPDKQLETLEFVTASRLPRFAEQASDLRSAVEALIIDIRHGSFGASLTATEKASFESMLNTGLSGTVGQLSKAIDRVRRKAAETAQTHFNASMTFYRPETTQVLSTSAVFGPATRKGGVYADVWTLPEAPAAGGVPAGMVRVKHSNGSTTTVDRATADRMLKDDPTNFSEAK